MVASTKDIKAVKTAEAVTREAIKADMMMMRKEEKQKQKQKH